MKAPDANDILRHGGKAELRAAIDSGTDVIDLPENLAAELATCRRLVAVARRTRPPPCTVAPLPCSAPSPRTCRSCSIVR